MGIGVGGGGGGGGGGVVTAAPAVIMAQTGRTDRGIVFRLNRADASPEWALRGMARRTTPILPQVRILGSGGSNNYLQIQLSASLVTAGQGANWRTTLQFNGRDAVSEVAEEGAAVLRRGQGQGNTGKTFRVVFPTGRNADLPGSPNTRGDNGDNFSFRLLHTSGSESVQLSGTIITVTARSVNNAKTLLEARHFTVTVVGVGNTESITAAGLGSLSAQGTNFTGGVNHVPGRSAVDPSASVGSNLVIISGLQASTTLNAVRDVLRALSQFNSSTATTAGGGGNTFGSTSDATHTFSAGEPPEPLRMELNASTKRVDLHYATSDTLEDCMDAADGVPDVTAQRIAGTNVSSNPEGGQTWGRPFLAAQYPPPTSAGSLTDQEIGDKAFSTPPSDLSDTEKTAVRNAIGAGTGSGGGGTPFTDAQIGDKAFSTPPSDLTSSEKDAVRAAIDLTDTEIGQKALQNPPTTLTDNEKSAVRTAIGAGTGSGSSLSDADIGTKAFDNVPTDLTANEQATIRTRLDTQEALTDDEIGSKAILNLPTNLNANQRLAARAALVAQARIGTSGSTADVARAVMENPVSTLTDGEKTAFRTAIGAGTGGGTPFTDAQIGDKAFSTPPSDLTDAEKLAARNAIGAGVGGGAATAQISQFWGHGQAEAAPRTPQDWAPVGSAIRYRWKSDMPDLIIGTDPGVRAATAAQMANADLITEAPRSLGLGGTNWVNLQNQHRHGVGQTWRYTGSKDAVYYIGTTTAPTGTPSEAVAVPANTPFSYTRANAQQILWIMKTGSGSLQLAGGRVVETLQDYQGLIFPAGSWRLTFAAGHLGRYEAEQKWLVVAVQATSDDLLVQHEQGYGGIQELANGLYGLPFSTTTRGANFTTIRTFAAETLLTYIGTEVDNDDEANGWANITVEKLA